MAAKRVSKTTADKLSFSRSVSAGIEVSGDSVAEKAEKILFAGRAKKIDVKQLLRELHALVQDAEEELESADAAHQDELSDDDPLREDRDTAKREVLDAILSARGMVSGAYGASFAKRVGLIVVLEERPDLVAKQGAAAVRLLRKAKAPKEAFADSKVNLKSVADELDGKVERLEELLGSLKKEEREAEKTLIGRDQAGERWSGVTGLAGAVFAMVAEIAGEHEIAARARPTDRRRAGIVDADPTGGEPTGTDVTGTDVTEPAEDDTEPTS